MQFRHLIHDGRLLRNRVIRLPRFQIIGPLLKGNHIAYRRVRLKAA